MKRKALVVALCLVSGTAFAFTANQAQRGKQLYAEQCAMCHGSSGQGGTVPAAVQGFGGMQAPALVGPGSLDTMHTAENFYSFIKAAMPLQSPGSLTQQDYLDIIAYNMEQNKSAKPDQTPLTMGDAAQVKLHPKQGGTN